MTRVALYARFSSDLQTLRSIEGQLAVLRTELARRGWQEAAVYTDEALSAASMLTRPGLQQMLADAADGRFDAVMAEALDRLSRDQADTAIIHRALQFAEVRLVTLSEQDVTPLHVGFKGLMNAMFLTELASKTRRGMRHRVAAGASAGGLSYGYATGAEPGMLVIHADEAAIVREIHARYAAGESPRRLVADLNARAVPGPRGRLWQASTIHGQRRNGNGILNNDLYIGQRIWNRRHKVTDPATGRKRMRPNPESEWMREDVPHLRILSDEAWAATKAMQTRQLGKSGGQRKRATRPLSGLMACTACGGPMTITARDRYGCSHQRQRGTCAERRTIASGEIERRVFAALERALEKPDALMAAGEAWRKHRAAAMRSASQARAADEAALARLDGQIERAVNAILDGRDSPALAARLKAMEIEKGEIEARLAASAPAPVVALPLPGARYVGLIRQLAIAAADPEAGQDVRNALHGVVSRISVGWTQAGEAEIFVEGDLGAMLHGAEGSLVLGAGTRIPPKRTGFAYRISA